MNLSIIPLVMLIVTVSYFLVGDVERITEKKVRNRHVLAGLFSVMIFISLMAVNFAP